MLRSQPWEDRVRISPCRALLLRFHAGKDKKGNISAVATGRMLATYNCRLRAYLAANHAMDTFAFHAVSGTDMVRKFGYHGCPAR
jgi:hypothetical protein